MAYNDKQFALNQVVTGTSATSRSIVFTASNGTVRMHQVTCKNSGASAITVHFYIKADSTTSGSLTSIGSVQVGAGSTEIISFLLAHVLSQGQTLQAHESGGTDATLTVSGSETR